MTRTIKAFALGPEHVGAKIRTTSLGWTIEGELGVAAEVVSGYTVRLQETDHHGGVLVLKDADVTILEEAPIRHPDEPTGLGAVVEADTGERKPVRWICSSDSGLGLRWLRPDGGIGEWYTWLEIQGEAIASIRVLSEGVPLSDDDDGDDESETPEKYTVIRPASEGTYHGDDEFEAFKVYEGMTLIDWPEDDEHLRDWVIGDYNGDEWIWKPLPGTSPARTGDGLSRASQGRSSPQWKVLRNRDDKEAGK